MSEDYEMFEEVDGDEEYKIRCLYADIDFDAGMKDDDENTLCRRFEAFFAVRDKSRCLGFVSYLYGASVYYCPSKYVFNGNEYKGIPPVKACFSFTSQSKVPKGVPVEKKKFRDIFNAAAEADWFFFNPMNSSAALPRELIARVFALMDDLQGQHLSSDYFGEVAEIKNNVCQEFYFPNGNTTSFIKKGQDAAQQKVFFTSDLHFGHANVIRFDNRPFETVEEMNEELIRRWNAKVGKGDLVYVLGDLIWRMQDSAALIRRLNGQIILIKGNHDRFIKQAPAKKLLAGVKDYDDICVTLEDGRRKRCILSHYFIPMYIGHRYNAIHLHGHSHNTDEAREEERITQELIDKGYSLRIYNVGCMYWDYAPVTLDEILRRYNVYGNENNTQG